MVIFVIVWARFARFLFQYVFAFYVIFLNIALPSSARLVDFRPDFHLPLPHSSLSLSPTCVLCVSFFWVFFVVFLLLGILFIDWRSIGVKSMQDAAISRLFGSMN